MPILMPVLMPKIGPPVRHTVSLHESLGERWTPRWNWGFASKEEGKNGCWVTPQPISFSLRLKAHGQPPSAPVSCLSETHPGQPIWKGPACMTTRLPSVSGFPSCRPRLLAGTPNSDPTVRWKRTAWVDSKAPTRCGDGSANSACVLGPVSRLGILEEETHYRADRSTHLFRTLRSSTCRGPAGVWDLGAMILDKTATPVAGQTFPEPSPTLPAMPGRWPVGAMCQPLLPHPLPPAPFLVGWGHLRQQEVIRGRKSECIFILKFCPCWISAGHLKPS